ncbi:MAG: sigma factor G inhibitor Gin [Bacillota bacterium]
MKTTVLSCIICNERGKDGLFFSGKRICGRCEEAILKSQGDSGYYRRLIRALRSFWRGRIPKADEK